MNHRRLQFTCPECGHGRLEAKEERVLKLAPYLWNNEYVDENPVDEDIVDRFYKCQGCGKVFDGGIDELYEDGTLKEIE